MKRLLSALLFLCATSLAAAQSHSVTISWGASTTAGVSGYNVYRAPCIGTVSAGNCTQEGTFAKIGSSSTTSYADTSVVAGGLYSYYITATCPSAGCSASVTGESAGSTHIAAVVPKDAPAPPTSPSITTVSRNSTGANVTLSASYTAAPNVPTNYSFMTGPTVLTRGTQVNGSGAYAVSWIGKLKPGSPVIFQVCDVNRQCDSRTV
jgi:hypothetical protein